MRRFIRQTGLEPWPKLFQNLRATRQTELADEYPEHVVCKWMGNSRASAREFELQMLDTYFEQASKADSHL